MPGIVLIGDELVCAGFRLAGVQARPTAAADVPAAFEAARQQADLVLLGHAAAAALPAGLLRRARLRGQPPVAVLPQLGAPAVDDDFRRRLRALLGLA